LLGLVRSITFTFSPLECMHRLYITLDLSLNTHPLSGIQLRHLLPRSWNAYSRGFAVLCFNRFSPQLHYCYSLTSEELKLHTSRMWRHRLDALFLTEVYLGSKFCSCVLEIVGLRVPGRYNRDFAPFSASSPSTNCPSVDVHQLLMLFAGTLTYWSQNCSP
jgi:hypothetical protein